MVTRTNASIEAIAAFLYNAIYDQDAGEGWTPEESVYDPSYRQVFLCFAEAILKVLETDSGLSSAEVVQWAAKVVDRARVGHSWKFIAMDEKIVSLLEVTEPHIDDVRDFLENPDGYPEGEFLQREL